MDIGIDILSVFSGVGLAERAGVSLSTKVIQIGSKYLKFNKLMKPGKNIKKSNFVKGLYDHVDKFNSVLEFISDPVGSLEERIFDKILSPFKSSKVGSFVSKYLDNNFRTFTSITGLDGSYDDAKNNIVNGINYVKSVKGAVFKKVRSMYGSASKLFKSTSKLASKVVSHVQKKIISGYLY